MIGVVAGGHAQRDRVIGQTDSSAPAAQPVRNKPGCADIVQVSATPREREAPMRNLALAVFCLAVLALAACAQGSTSRPAEPPGPSYDSGDRMGGDGGGGGGDGM
jgi:hypothetical protein